MLRALLTRTRPVFRAHAPEGIAAVLGFACYQTADSVAVRCFSSGGSNPYPPPDASRGATADLCDVHLPNPVDVVCQRKVQIVEPIFRDYGGHIRFNGQATTVKCYENNPLVRQALEEDGKGRVLVVDGGASMRCALLGDNIAEMGHKNGWSVLPKCSAKHPHVLQANSHSRVLMKNSCVIRCCNAFGSAWDIKGIIIYGCIRDSEDIGKMPLGVKALNTYPLKSSKRDSGLRDVPVSFGGATVRPGDWIYADKDGILVSPEQLTV